MKNRLEQIQVIKVENGFVVNVAGQSYVSLDEDGVKTIIEGEVPRMLESLNKEEPKDARPEQRPEEAATTTS